MGFHDCRMISYTPYYIIFGEFGIPILLALFAKHVSRGTWTTALLAGTAGGLGIFLCSALAYPLTDGLA